MTRGAWSPGIGEPTGAGSSPPPLGRRRRRLVASLLGLSLFGACGFFPFSPHEVRLNEDQRDLHAKNLSRLLAEAPTLPLRFVLIGDIQVWHTEARDAVNDINRIEDLDFAVQLGDLTEFGLAKEFRWTQGILSDLAVPYFAVIGNHDLLANGRALYEAMYGETDFFFDVARTRFIFMDDSSREYGFDGTVPNLHFLDAALADRGAFDRAVAIAHVPPWNEQFDSSLETPFTRTLHEGGVVISAHGHTHKSEDAFFYGNRVRYLVAPAMESRAYLLVVLDEDGITVEEVSF